jgi:tetratricopeptide (TPR) repeat protein
MKFAFRPDFVSSFRKSGILVFLFVWEVGLAGCSLPLPPPSKPVFSPHPIVKEKRSAQPLLLTRVLSEISQKNYRTALTLARRLHTPSERTTLILLIEGEWSLDRQRRVIDLFDKRNDSSAYEELQKIEKTNNQDYMTCLLILKPHNLSRYLLHVIRSGQEKAAIRMMKQLQPYKQMSFGSIVSVAYVHWAFRRFHQDRFHDALFLARQSQSVNPNNKLAQSVITRVITIENKYISRGMLAYRHQKIHLAINDWQQALNIDPSNTKVKEYILQAQGILKKIRNLKDHPAVHNKPT